jgi:DNA polymerase elongation subunit (family B)
VTSSNRAHRSIRKRHTLRMMQDIASIKGFTVVAGDTDSLFLNSGNYADKTIQEFIAECKDRIGVDVEHFLTFVKAAIIKKKYYFAVTTSGEIKVVGMEGKKN